jgi:rhomboid protease GluP
LTRLPKSLLLPNVSYINAIIVACIVLYALALLLGMVWMPSFTNLLTPSDIALYKLGMTGRLPVANGRWWTLITAIYLHGGILHITFNMLAIYQAGPLVERLFGPYRFFLIYTMSGLFGALVSTLMGTHLTVGASGAIFGLMGALIYYGHRIGELRRFLPILRWAAINFLLGMSTPQVDNWGHAGGFVGGILIAMAFMTPQGSRLAYTFYGRLATIALVVTVIAFGLSLLAPMNLVH